MEWIFLTLAVIYGCVIFSFYIGLNRIRNQTGDSKLTVSVLVPARNEENNIISCLESLHSQSYPRELYEVIIIDDNSTDRTSDLVQEYIQDKSNFRLIKKKNDVNQCTFKKQALKSALNAVKNEIIMTIDADTVANERWIELMTAQYENDTGLVAGLVSFPRRDENTLFKKIQTLEFAGVVFAGVGSVGNNIPLICNGSNLSYRLKTFKEAGGYDANIHLPSGDDDLLLQNIHGKTNWRIKYSLIADTINYTRATDRLLAFINQRARWASKSLHYPKKWVFLLMLSFYLYYLSIPVFAILTVFGYFSVSIFLVGFVLKLTTEAFVISKALKILNRRDLWIYFFPTQVFQIIYVLLVGILGLFNKFTWRT
jgi:cellulose synthase/poly-beta-1,6-N-acetylglucosamine synthase-like glycosyltransferase